MRPCVQSRVRCSYSSDVFTVCWGNVVRGGPQGVMLGCCRDDSNKVSVHLTAFGACDDNSACAASGMEGMCCPTEEQVYLSCCDDKSNKVRVAANCAEPRHAFASRTRAGAHCMLHGMMCVLCQVFGDVQCVGAPTDHATAWSVCRVQQEPALRDAGRSWQLLSHR